MFINKISKGLLIDLGFQLVYSVSMLLNMYSVIYCINL